MKHIFTLIAFLISIVFLSHSQAQCVIPNASFENWETSGDELTPTFWSAANATQSTDAQSGQYSIMLKAKELQGFTSPSLAIGAFDCDSRPNYLLGYIKTRPNQNDTVIVLLVFKNGSEGVGAGAAMNILPRNQFTQFYIPISYLNNAIPTTANITIQVSTRGTEVKFDNFSFSNTPAGVNLDDVQSNSIAQKLVSPSQLRMEIYPMPASHMATISFQSTMAAVGKLRLLNLLGTEVRQLGMVQLLPGKNEQEINLKGLNPGIYFVQLSTGAGEVNQRLIVK